MLSICLNLCVIGLAGISLGFIYKLWLLTKSRALFLIAAAVFYLAGMRVALLVNPDLRTNELAIGFWIFFVAGIATLYYNLRDFLKGKNRE